MSLLITVLCVLSLVLHGPAIASNEEEGLAAVLQGVEPGMPLKEFWELQPDARGANADRFLGSDAIAQQHQTLYLDASADAWLELPLMASFGFIDHKLDEWVLNWRDATGDSVRLQTFFEGCIAQHGADFEREAIRLYTAAPGEEELDVLLPVLLWREEAHVVFAYHQRRTITREGTDREHDHFIYAMLPEDDPFVEQVLVGQQLDESERSALYAPFPWLPEGTPLESGDSATE